MANELQTRDIHIRRSGDDYWQAFANLLPHGQAWPRWEDSTLMRTARGLAQVFGFFDARAADLLEQESDPRKTIELLEDWERNWGLPDPCFRQALTIDQRHELLLFKMTLLGGQSREFFINMAAWLGYEISITEYAPFMAGVSQCGDTRGMIAWDDTPGQHPEVEDFRWEIAPEEIRFYWTVHVKNTPLAWFRAGSGEAGVDHHLEFTLAENLECLINRWKPAFTIALFDYSGLGQNDSMAGTP